MTYHKQNSKSQFADDTALLVRWIRVKIRLNVVKASKFLQMKQYSIKIKTGLEGI